MSIERNDSSDHHSEMWQRDDTLYAYLIEVLWSWDVDPGEELVVNFPGYDGREIQNALHQVADFLAAFAGDC